MRKNHGLILGNYLLFRFLLSVVLIIVWDGKLQAEKNGCATHVMDEIIVTSTTKSKMIDVPASISIITAEYLQKIGAKNIIEALERIPGVYNTSASRTSLSIRGTRSSMAGGPLVMVDGVAQKYGPYRNEELDIIPVSQIERIEIVRSAGIIAGLGAGRGVINIITKKGKTDKPVAFDFSSNYGSWQTHNLDAAISGSNAMWDYYGNYSRFNTDGYEDEDEERDSFLMRVGYRPSENTRIGFRGNWFIYDREFSDMKDAWELSNFRKSKHFPDGDWDGDLVWHAAKEQTSRLYAVEANHKLNNLFVDGGISYGKFEETYHDTKDIYTSSRTSRGDVDNSDQDTYSAFVSGGYSFSIDSIAYLLTLGVNFDDIDFRSRRIYPYDTVGARSTAAYDIDIEETQVGLYWDNDLMFGDHWAIKIGSRMDWVELDYWDKTPLHFDSDDTLWSWSIAPAYHFGSNANVYLSVGRNYWFPTPKYFQWAASYDTEGNRPEDLEPEESLTYEIGYKHLFHRAFNVNATAYFMKQNDKFAGYYEDGDFKGMKNSGESETIGLEVQMDGRLLDWFGYRISGTYIDAEWQSGTQKVKDHPGNEDIVIDLEGHQVLGIPEITYQVGVDFYPTSALQCSINVNTFGEYYIDYLNRLKYPSKTTVNASISYTWKAYKFWILGKNIFDEEIEKPRNTDGELLSAGGMPATEYYVQDGVYVEAGISLRF